MFDIWLNESKQLVQEIILESNLKEILEKKINSFMNSDKLNEWLDRQVENNVAYFVERYVRDTIEDYGDTFHPSVNEDAVKHAVVKVIEEKFK